MQGNVLKVVNRKVCVLFVFFALLIFPIIGCKKKKVKRKKLIESVKIYKIKNGHKAIVDGIWKGTYFRRNAFDWYEMKKDGSVEKHEYSYLFLNVSEKLEKKYQEWRAKKEFEESESKKEK